MSLDNERFYPASPDAVYTALLAAAGRLKFKVKSTDNFAKAVSMSTPASGFSWGATLSASVIPREGGAVVSMGGAAKVRVNVTAKSAEFKNTVKLLDTVSLVLQGK